MALVPTDFGRLLRVERRERRWTQARLAARAGLDRATVVRLERGERMPTADTVFRLEEALDMHPARFVSCWPEWRPIADPEPGARSRERRRSLDLSLAAVAGRAGISVATLSRFERAETGTPTLLRVETSEDGGRWGHLVSEPLALALGFASLEEHAAYCDGG